MNLRFKDGKAKALTLSYDDGVIQDIRLANLFSEYGIKATFNLISEGFAGEEDDAEFRRLKISEAKKFNLKVLAQ